MHFHSELLDPALKKWLMVWTHEADLKELAKTKNWLIKYFVSPSFFWKENTADDHQHAHTLRRNNRYEVCIQTLWKHKYNKLAYYFHATMNLLCLFFLFPKTRTRIVGCRCLQKCTHPKFPKCQVQVLSYQETSVKKQYCCMCASCKNPQNSLWRFKWRGLNVKHVKRGFPNLQLI